MAAPQICLLAHQGWVMNICGKQTKESHKLRVPKKTHKRQVILGISQKLETSLQVLLILNQRQSPCWLQLNHLQFHLGLTYMQMILLLILLLQSHPMTILIMNASGNPVATMQPKMQPIHNPKLSMKNLKVNSQLQRKESLHGNHLEETNLFLCSYNLVLQCTRML